MTTSETAPSGLADRPAVTDPGSRLVGQRRRLVLGLALLLLALKCVIAARTYGTNDIRHWTDFVNGVAERGPVGVYGITFERSFYNHPPVIGYFLQLVDLGRHHGAEHRILDPLGGEPGRRRLGAAGVRDPAPAPQPARGNLGGLPGRGQPGAGHHLRLPRQHRPDLRAVHPAGAVPARRSRQAAGRRPVDGYRDRDQDRPGGGDPGAAGAGLHPRPAQPVPVRCRLHRSRSASPGCRP